SRTLPRQGGSNARVRRGLATTSAARREHPPPTPTTMMNQLVVAARADPYDKPPGHRPLCLAPPTQTSPPRDHDAALGGYPHTKAFAGSSSRAATSARNREPCSPSTSRWSNDSPSVVTQRGF